MITNVIKVKNQFLYSKENFRKHKFQITFGGGWGCIRGVWLESRINISNQKKNSESINFKLFEVGDGGEGGRIREKVWGGSS